MTYSEAVPTISKNSPLKFENVHEGYLESKIEKGGRVVFVAGIIYTTLILLSTWLVFAFWIKNN